MMKEERMSVNIRWLVFIVLIQGVLWAETEGTVQSLGAVISYRTFGDGPPLLIINGGPGMNSNGFEVPAKRFAKHFRTILYDQRGTGRSIVEKRKASSMTMDLMVEDMERLRKHLKLEQWSILGHSFGGMLASYYAVKHPDRITSLVLSSSGGIDLELTSYVRASINRRLTKMEFDSVRYWENRIEKGDTSYHARYRRGTSLAPAYLVDRKHIPLLAHRLTQSDPEINGWMWEDMQKIRFNCAPGLQQFSSPVLIIQGKQDIIAAETAERSRAAFSNSRIVLLDSCGHYGWLDREQEYFSTVERFLLNRNEVN
jgi:proline iminopeptidase